MISSLAVNSAQISCPYLRAENIRFRHPGRGEEFHVSGKEICQLYHEVHGTRFRQLLEATWVRSAGVRHVDRATDSVLSRCGLALPADNVLVQSTKQCAIRSGFNTPAVRQLCQCVAGSGVRWVVFSAQAFVAS